MDKKDQKKLVANQLVKVLTNIETLSDVFLISRNIINRENKIFTLIPYKEGFYKVLEKKFILEEIFNEDFVIITGLSKGTLIATSNIDNLVDGQIVKVSKSLF